MVVNCIPGAKISDISERISDVANTPRYLLLNIGSNHISQAKNPNQVMRPLLLYYGIQWRH